MWKFVVDKKKDMKKFRTSNKKSPPAVIYRYQLHYILDLVNLVYFSK
jgi:hypothetical protein